MRRTAWLKSKNSSQQKPLSADDKLKRLTELGAAELARTLVELSIQHCEVNDVVERLLAAPEENVERFRQKLASITNVRGYVDWRQVDMFADELESLLRDLKAGVKDPRIGLQFLVQFFEMDDEIMGLCDDSSGAVGNVFMYDATELFWQYAAKCPDKDWVFDLAIGLAQEDDYGVRGALCGKAAEFLQEQDARAFIGRLWKLTNEQTDGKHWISTIASLAKGLKDPVLFATCTRMLSGEIHGQKIVEMAQLCLDAGDAKQALSWMEQLSERKNEVIWGKDDLLLKMHAKLNNKNEVVAIAWRRFHASRSKDSFEDLIAVLGEGQRASIIKQEVNAICQSKGLSLEDAGFLIEVGRLQDLEEYVLKRASQLRGEQYYSLPPIAEALEKSKGYLASSLIFRCLLDSILERAQSRAYHHGEDYLIKLTSMAPKIKDWSTFKPHEEYVAALREAHSRKHGFWNRFPE